MCVWVCSLPLPRNRALLNRHVSGRGGGAALPARSGTQSCGGLPSPLHETRGGGGLGADRGSVVYAKNGTSTHSGWNLKEAGIEPYDAESSTTKALGVLL